MNEAISRVHDLLRSAGRTSLALSVELDPSTKNIMDVVRSLSSDSQVDVAAFEALCTVVAGRTDDAPACRATVDAVDPAPSRDRARPCPVERALARMLEYMPQGTTVFRRGDGAPISAASMLDMLRDGDPDAAAFLEDVYGAAVTMVRATAKKDAPTARASHTVGPVVSEVGGGLVRLEMGDWSFTVPASRDLERFAARHLYEEVEVRVVMRELAAAVEARRAAADAAGKIRSTLERKGTLLRSELVTFAGVAWDDVDRGIAWLGDEVVASCDGDGPNKFSLRRPPQSAEGEVGG